MTLLAYLLGAFEHIVDPHGYILALETHHRSSLNMYLVAPKPYPHSIVAMPKRSKIIALSSDMTTIRATTTK